MRCLYPEISPFHTFFLETPENHRVYVEQSGNPAGIPVIFLHGGPCSGTNPNHRRFFNPTQYHIILLDQRGCGLSEPFGEINYNTTPFLLVDLEAIRQKLGISSWVLFGGSWGATLALLYAQRYPNQVLGMILRGAFLARQTDMDWFLGHGVNRIYPQQWQDLVNCLAPEYANNVAQGLYDTVFGSNQAAAKLAAKHWQTWGALVALGADFKAEVAEISEREWLQVKMELHYAKNNYFITENEILANCHLLQNIPSWIIHGQHDLTCPLESGWLLKHALPHSQYHVLPNAGHIARGNEMIDALVSATDELAKIL